MNSRFSIVVEGINDASLVADIEKAVRESFEQMVLPGPWQVVVRPSVVSGRWDFNVQGVDVHHKLSITVPANLLPSLIPKRLIESLNRITSTKVESSLQRALAIRRVV